MAILDSLDIIQLSLMSYRTNLCALSGDINCVSDGISKIVQFMIDVILWPILLTADFANNPTLGIFGVFIVVFIIWLFFGRER